MPQEEFPIVGKTVAKLVWGKERDELRRIEFTDGSLLYFGIGWTESREWVEVEYECTFAERAASYGLSVEEFTAQLAEPLVESPSAPRQSRKGA